MRMREKFVAFGENGRIYGAACRNLLAEVAENACKKRKNGKKKVF
jgi:hypothetical protein